MASNRHADRCPEHPNSPVVEDYAAGDRICKQCGLVIGDRVVDVRTEWRTFSASDKKQQNDPSRVGAAQDPLLNGSELSTLVSNAPGSVNLQRWNSRGSAGNNRSLQAAFRTIVLMASRISMPDKVVQHAKRLYKQVDDSKQLRGRSHDAIAAACLYIACRQEKVARTFTEIDAVSGVPRKEVGRCYKKIQRVLDLDVGQVKNTDFMSRFTGQLGLPRSIEVAAREIGRIASALGIINSKSPVTISAAAIFMASQASSTPTTAKRVAEIARCAESTLKLCYRDMYPLRHYLFPANFKFTVSVDALPYLGDTKIDVSRYLEVAEQRGLKPIASVKVEPGMNVKTEPGVKIEPGIAVAAVKAEPGIIAAAQVKVKSEPVS